jgi:hypothetical protein
MKIQSKTLGIAVLAIAALSGTTGIVRAQEADTNLTTIAYWKMNLLSTNIPFAGGPTVGIPDLATNVGQGVLAGNAPASASEDDLYVWGAIQGTFNITNDAPPASLFNRGFNGGGASWNSAANLGQGGQVFFPQDQFGNEFAGPSFTEEIIFKSTGPSSVKQTLIWNHQSSAYVNLQVNEDGNTGDLTFWGYDGSNIQAVRISNGSGRFDDGNWHCAVCRFDATSKVMSLYAINQDGTSVSNAIVLTSNLNPEGANNLYIGRTEGEGDQFNGEINQVRMSGVALQNSALLAAPGGSQNPHIIGYWQMNNENATPPELFGQPAILDLATNVGQGVLNGSATNFDVPASVDNLVVEGLLGGNMVFSSAVPPGSMFNPAYPTNQGTASWDAGQLAPSSGDVAFPYDVYEDELNTPSFTEEIFFMSDATMGAKQTLIFNHHTSAYCILQINEDGPTGDLTFFSYNGNFPAIRITTAQNGGQRFDDGNWHFAACRYDAGTQNMSLYVYNQDGSYATLSLPGTPQLLPGGSGYTIIGNDETDTLPFNGLINQVRMSDVALADQELLGVPPPACVPPVIVTSPLPSTNYINDVARFSVNAGGSDPQYQWLLNGVNLAGQNNASLTVFPVQTTNAGNYTVVVSTPCSGLSVTSAPALLTVIPSTAPIVNVARWSMEFNDTVPNNNGVPTFNGIDDSDTGSGQGVYTTGGLPPAIDDLITFNAGAGGVVPVTNDVAPTSMFINGNTAGGNSFNASLLNGADGAVFFPQDQYGDEFDYQTSFSIELFFKTIGNQSAAGKMQLIAQGSDAGPFRYGVDVNEAGPGFVMFAITNNESYQAASVTNANYCDGNWHYLLAKYDSTGNQISLTVVDANGAAATATTSLPAGFSPLFGGNTGNMFIGRYNYGWNPPVDDPRNFLGLIDEIQVTTGLVTPATGQLGYVPSVVTPDITSISVGGGIATIKFTGGASDPASAFTLVGSPTVNGSYLALPATITSLGSGNFQATTAAGGSMEFCRIKR